MPVVFSHTSFFRKLYQYTTIGMVSTAGLLPISYAWKYMLHYFFPKQPQDYEIEKEKIWAKVLSRQRVPKP